MKVDTTLKEWKLLKEKFIELYHLNKDPDWTLEKHLKLIKEIETLQNKVIV